MKKKILSLVLAATLVMGMSLSAFAASSSSSSSSSSSGSSSGGGSAAPAANVSSAAAAAATVGTVNANTVRVGGTTLTAKNESLGNSLSALGAQGGGAAIAAAMATPPSAQFQATVDAFGGNVTFASLGAYKPAVATDSLGNAIASVKINTTGDISQAVIVLVGVMADGTTQVVEGVVDPITQTVMGAFVGAPAVINANVMLGK